MATDNLTASPQGVSGTNALDNSNTKDYSESIKNQYAQMAQEAQNTANQAVTAGTDTLNAGLEKGVSQYKALYEQAQRDQADQIATQRGIEAHNGNRGGIGHASYGVAENTYDTEIARIGQAQRQLETDTARKIADLRAQGDYAAADAALASAQAQFQQMYEAQLRADENLRSNYEWNTTLQRQDDENSRKVAEEVRDLEWEDEAYARKLGELFLSKGLMPTDRMLEMMGITAEDAQRYIGTLFGAYGYGYGYSGGSSGGGYSGGGSSSGGSSGSGSGSGGGSGSSGETGTTGTAGDLPTYYGNYMSGYLARYIRESAEAGYNDRAQRTLDEAATTGTLVPATITRLQNTIDNSRYKQNIKQATADKKATLKNTQLEKLDR